MVDEKTLIKLYKRARVHGLWAYYGRYRHLAEDFSSWYVIKLLENKSRLQTIEQAFIDFLRVENPKLDASVVYRRGNWPLGFEPMGQETMQTDPFVNLTAFERNFLHDLITHGKDYKSFAKKRKLTMQSVYCYMTWIMWSLGINKRTNPRFRLGHSRGKNQDTQPLQPRNQPQIHKE